jgi:hypothetical protein
VSTSLKAAIIGLLFASVAYSQTKTPENSPVHPGTAILDAMGIYAGEPVAPTVPPPLPGTSRNNSDASGANFCASEAIA